MYMFWGIPIANKSSPSVCGSALWARAIGHDGLDSLPQLWPQWKAWENLGKHINNIRSIGFSSGEAIPQTNT